MVDLAPAKILSISELNAIVRGLLETRMGEIRLRGEISNFSRPQSGHMYFTLKDSRAQIRCAMFKNRSFGLRFKPGSGMQVVATGRVSLYEARGDYQFIVDKLEEDGTGDLQLQFERLKQRLHADGLFDAAHKQALPEYPQSIAIITSATGAALQDIMHVLERRYPALRVYILPASVQGEEAEHQLLTAFETLKTLDDVEVVLLARGGGSIEDLWVFNSERLAQAIYDCEIPVVSGIGHEIDFTIADFVSDYRAPTPSAAAEVITPELQKLHAILDGFEGLFARRMQQILQDKAQHLDWLVPRLQQLHPSQSLIYTHEKINSCEARLTQHLALLLHSHKQEFQRLSSSLQPHNPNQSIQNAKEKLSMLAGQLKRATSQQLKSAKAHAGSLSRTLTAMGPNETLKRGYAIVRKGSRDGEIIRSAGDVAEGSPLQIKLYEGEIGAKVETIKPDAKP